MKSILFGLLLFANATYGQTKTYDYAYMRKANIYVYSAVNKKEVFIAGDGVNPCISPDGKKLAYTINGKMGPARFIRIIDLATRKKFILNTHNDNCYGPVWSPDGKYIAYNAFNKGDWNIGVINVLNNTAPEIVSAENSFSPHWLSGSTSVMVHNMNKITVYNLAGKAIKDYNMKDLESGIPELKGMVGNASSDDFILTPDDKKMVFNCLVNEPGENGPPLAVFVYDFNAKKTFRLSPKGYTASNLSMKNGKVVFAASKINSGKVNTYSVDLDGKNYKLFLTDCYSMSMSQ